MMNGITYRGRHSREFGLIIKAKTRPAMPPVRDVKESVLYKDGSLDFSENGGRLFYDDKVLEIELICPTSNIESLNRRISQIVGWMAGGFDDLIFDDMPLVRWKAKPVSLDSLTVEHFRIGRAVVQFRCDPFNRLIFDSSGIPIGSSIPIGYQCPIGYGLDHEVAIESNSTEIRYEYIGNAPCAPLIELNGGMTGVEIEYGNITLSIDPSVGTCDSHGGIFIDCENWRCYGGDGVDLTPATAGDYFEFTPGENTLLITSGNTGTGNVRLWLTPAYFYGDLWGYGGDEL